MLRVHTKDGSTIHLDLQDADQAREWMEKRRSPKYQESITGISIIQKYRGGAVQYSIARPEDFDRVFFDMENIEPNGKFRGGERVVCFAGDTRAIVLVHREKKSVRFAMRRVGKHIYNPMAE